MIAVPKNLQSLIDLGSAAQQVADLAARFNSLEQAENEARDRVTRLTAEADDRAAAAARMIANAETKAAAILAQAQATQAAASAETQAAAEAARLQAAEVIDQANAAARSEAAALADRAAKLNQDIDTYTVVLDAVRAETQAETVKLAEIRAAIARLTGG